MHQPIRDNLEEYLKGSTHRVPQEFHTHLEGCEECASELRLFQGQAEMLRSLQTDGELDPRAGFYARVMDRIEQQGSSSVWSALLQPNFGRRLAMASAVLVMLLGTYLVSTDSVDTEVPPTGIALTGAPPATAVADQDNLQQERQRDAVLVNLAAYHE
jgi:predicted anti-sigma-YlaC factor YlaD